MFCFCLIKFRNRINTKFRNRIDTLMSFEKHGIISTNQHGSIWGPRANTRGPNLIFFSSSQLHQRQSPHPINPYTPTNHCSGSHSNHLLLSTLKHHSPPPEAFPTTNPHKPQIPQLRPATRARNQTQRHQKRKKHQHPTA